MVLNTGLKNVLRRYVFLCKSEGLLIKIHLLFIRRLVAGETFGIVYILLNCGVIR